MIGIENWYNHSIKLELSMNTNNKANNQIISSFAKKDPKDALIEILINILIPIVILSNFSSEERLGIKLSIIIAFALPLTYGLYDYLRTKNKNFFYRGTF